MLKHKHSYHSNIALALQLGILDNSFLSIIPRSTKHYLKNKDLSLITGQDFFKPISDNLPLFIQLSKYKHLLSVCSCIIRIHKALVKIQNSSLSSLESMKLTVNSINSTKDILGLDRALRFFSISRNQFFSWSHRVKFPCKDSFSSLCVKRWPNQISVSSLCKLNSFLSDPVFSSWPVSSIAHYARRINFLHLSVNTWHKYFRLLNLSRRVPRSNRKSKIGIRADKPNRIWHADVTIFRTMDNIKIYIYLVVDNFSRKILSWKASTRLSGKIRVQTIIDAFNKFHNNTADTDVLFDDGTENNNSSVDSFFNSESIPLNKIIAQKDIRFSNSMVEAVNKILKYRWLFTHDVPNLDSLINHLNYFIPIYNDVRPHVSLKGLTPSEAFDGISLDKHDLKQKMQNFRILNLNENRNSACTVCD